MNSATSPDDPSPASSRLRPCPACDAAGREPLEVLALGVSLGACFQMHAITEAMCPVHRGRYLRAMILASAPPRVTEAP